VEAYRPTVDQAQVVDAFGRAVDSGVKPLVGGHIIAKATKLNKAKRKLLNDILMAFLSLKDTDELESLLAESPNANSFPSLAKCSCYVGQVVDSTAANQGAVAWTTGGQPVAPRRRHGREDDIDGKPVGQPANHHPISPPIRTVTVFNMRSASNRKIMSFFKTSSEESTSDESSSSVSASTQHHHTPFEEDLEESGLCLERLKDDFVFNKT
jgi:hypothetical protein